ncbi:MAG: hypothetical protein N4A57_12510 [Anaeromicrobium sp.]|jgi:tetratricopeptide (TPR) repeat protein|uniref:tetratricopeptide repeat protein n=1 Tax=Anaeromicrobium sp. TaxID=1929132 RepID=UPI0025CEA90C|nr:hypothetical protein [Anaeromicrobium sp.]MCT4595073.1 hypothetical protein [Anaeromicrobium sp.]
MSWQQKFKEGEELIRVKDYNGAISHFNNMLGEYKDEPKVYYWSLKYLGDIIGHMTRKDFFQAIDLYQKIINEYEGEDKLYELCQIDIARSYLEVGFDMLNNFDSMTQMIEIEDDEIAQYFEKIMKKRNDYIERAAEAIYKERL